MDNTIYYVCKYTPKEIFSGFDQPTERLDPAPANFECAESCTHPNLIFAFRTAFGAVTKASLIITMQETDDAQTTKRRNMPDSRTKIAELLRSTAPGTDVVVKGWVRTKRGNKNVAFIAVNDGSIIHNIQIVADVARFDDSHPSPGCCRTA